MRTARTPTDRSLRFKRLQLALTALGVLLLAVLVIDRIFFDSSSSPEGTGSGVATTQARPLPPFTSIDLAGGNNVIVRVGHEQSVSVHADSNLVERVTTRVRSGRLVIGTTPGSMNARTPMYVAVSVPSLDDVRLHGAGNINVTGIHSRSLVVVLAGSGNIHAAGTTRKLDVTLGGQGNTLLRELVARDAKAVLSGDGSMLLTATHSLAATISGSGTVVYGGHPAHVTPTISGSGTIAAQ